MDGHWLLKKQVSMGMGGRPFISTTRPFKPFSVPVMMRTFDVDEKSESLSFFMIKNPPLIPIPK
jgi:hypothetical protein